MKIVHTSFENGRHKWIIRQKCLLVRVPENLKSLLHLFKCHWLLQKLFAQDIKSRSIVASSYFIPKISLTLDSANWSLGRVVRVVHISVSARGRHGRTLAESGAHNTT